MSTEALIKPTVVRYWSTSDNFTITRIKPNELIQPNGKLVVTNMSEYMSSLVEFQNNQYEAKVGEKVYPSGPNGEDEDEVTFLERLPSFGIHFHRLDDGAPDAGPVHEQITQLAIQGDLDGLLELGRVEQENWAREQVGHALITALGGLYRATEDEKRQQEIQAVYEQLVELGVKPPDPEG